MKKVMWLIGLIILSLVGLMTSGVNAQDEAVNMNHLEDWEEVAGKVETINYDTSILTIKAYSGETKAFYQILPILITREAKILKHGKRFSLKDIKSGDKVTIRYIVTANGQKEAYYLWVRK